MSGKKLTVDAELEKLQRETFGYFWHETNPANGLVIDKTAADWPASIAATGLALAAYPVAVERGFISRAAAVERTLATLRFFWESAQGPEPVPVHLRAAHATDDSRQANLFLCHRVFPISPKRSVITWTASSERKLMLMNAMSEFDASNRNGSIGKRLETFHGSASPLDRSMVLLNDVIQVL